MIKATAIWPQQLKPLPYLNFTQYITEPRMHARLFNSFRSCSQILTTTAYGQQLASGRENIKRGFVRRGNLSSCFFSCTANITTVYWNTLKILSCISILTYHPSSKLTEVTRENLIKITDSISRRRKSNLANLHLNHLLEPLFQYLKRIIS